LLAMETDPQVLNQAQALSEQTDSKHVFPLAGASTSEPALASSPVAGLSMAAMTAAVESATTMKSTAMETSATEPAAIEASIIGIPTVTVIVWVIPVIRIAVVIIRVAAVVGITTTDKKPAAEPAPMKTTTMEATAVKTAPAPMATTPAAPAMSDGWTGEAQCA
jgi:hypothetical protein